MLRSPSSLIIQPNSGFVPFSGGGTVAGDLDVLPPASRHAPAPAHAADATPKAMRSAVWAPASTAHVRSVEMLVLASVCGYFTFGLGKLLGLL
jgi:hypothetical protein